MHLEGQPANKRLKDDASETISSDLLLYKYSTNSRRGQLLGLIRKNIRPVDLGMCKSSQSTHPARPATWHLVCENSHFFIVIWPRRGRYQICVGKQNLVNGLQAYWGQYLRHKEDIKHSFLNVWEQKNSISVSTQSSLAQKLHTANIKWVLCEGNVALKTAFGIEGFQK